MNKLWKILPGINSDPRYVKLFYDTTKMERLIMYIESIVSEYSINNHEIELRLRQRGFGPESIKKANMDQMKGKASPRQLVALQLIENKFDPSVIYKELPLIEALRVKADILDIEMNRATLLRFMDLSREMRCKNIVSDMLGVNS